MMTDYCDYRYKGEMHLQIVSACGESLQRPDWTSPGWTEWAVGLDNYTLTRYFSCGCRAHLGNSHCSPRVYDSDCCAV